MFSFNNKGFTLVELLVALMVTSIVFGAVATLAYALGSANDATEDSSKKQAQVRCATLRISELIRYCKLVCASHQGDIVIWKADNNPANGKMDLLELAYLQAGNGGSSLEILEFTSCSEAVGSWFRGLASQITYLKQDGSKASLISQCSSSLVRIIPQCSNISFYIDTTTPWTKFVSVSFNLVEDGITSKYQINAGLRGWAGHYLNSSGTSIVSDDD
jgi:prepilin-type N-terminal cleavage/methylation domain-containing protein